MKKLAILCGLALSLYAAPRSQAATACGSVAGNLVSNCSFETGTFSSWTLSGNDVTAGLEGNLYGVEQGQDPFTLVNPLDGSYQVYTGDQNSNALTISQTIATLVGSTYTVSFYVAQSDATTDPGFGDELIVKFGGTTLASLTGIGPQGYTLYSYTGTATSASTALALTFGNQLGYFNLDNVAVTQNAAVGTTPEPSGLALLATGLVGAIGAGRRKLFAGK